MRCSRNGAYSNNQPCVRKRDTALPHEVIEMSSKMLFYILKRILLALLTIWIVITVTFFVMHAVPGNPFAGEKSLPQVDAVATLLRSIQSL